MENKGVHDFHIPPRVKEVEVKGAQPKGPDDTEYWESVKATKRARREALEEDQAIKTLENPPAPPEPAFKVHGSVNMGDFNVQEEARLAREKQESERAAHEKKEEALRTELNQSQKDLADTKMTALMKQMSDQFVAVMKEMNAKIDSVRQGADPSNMGTYIDSLEKIAQKMGYQRGGASPIGDPALAIELQKMKAEEANRERQWQLELKKFDYEIARQGRKDEAEIHFKQEEAERQKKKDEMFASAPELIGKAIARGMMEEGGAAPVMKEAGQGYQVTAVKGEAGDIECPKCRGDIVVGPTAKKAVCARCNLTVSVIRTAATEVAAEPVKEEVDEERGGR